MNKALNNKKAKIDFRLEVVKKSEKAVVYLAGDIVDERPLDWWTGEPKEGDYITPKEVRDLFENIEEEKIELHINSYGGSVFASIAIFNYLKALGKEITTVNDGICASGASLIFMAGKQRVMPENTMLMIHRASTFAWGNCNDLREQADILEKLDNSTVMVNYKNHFKGTDEELMDLIDKETWLSADECLSYGFCTEVKNLVEPKEDKTENTVDNENEILNKGIKLMQNFANLKIKEI